MKTEENQAHVNSIRNQGKATPNTQRRENLLIREHKYLAK